MSRSTRTASTSETPFCLQLLFPRKTYGLTWPAAKHLGNHPLGLLLPVNLSLSEALITAFSSPGATTANSPPGTPKATRAPGSPKATPSAGPTTAPLYHWVIEGFPICWCVPLQAPSASTRSVRNLQKQFQPCVTDQRHLENHYICDTCNTLHYDHVLSQEGLRFVTNLLSATLFGIC